jgi:glycerol-3-phosphate acyltransferase PlsX
MRIAVDAMGGDEAPSVVVEGALRALERAPIEVQILLFGPEEDVQRELDAQDRAAGQPIQVVDAPEVIGMGEAPGTAVKKKQRSSIHRGLGAVKEKQADAFVSAGNTGAIMAASLFILGRVPGVERPTIIGYFPTFEGSCLVTDIGSNVDCKPEHLVQFAQMSSIYARHVFENDDPTVALLNIGEEPGKGNEQAKATYELLQDTPDIHFRGNIEGGDIFTHAADIVICDGFVGNVLLKFGESVTTVLPRLAQQEMQRQGLAAKEQQMVGRVLKGVKKGFDPEERGGAPLLGVNGHVLVGHGRSTARAIQQLILSAADTASKDVVSPMVSTFAA